MGSYFITEKFTLIPKHLYNQNYLNEMFDITDQDIVKNIELEKQNAILSYVAPQNSGSEEELPLVYGMIEYAYTLKDYNKVVINFCKEKNLTHIVAVEDSRLLLANTYRTTDAKSILYFATLVAQQVMFNPHLTKIHIYGTLENDGMELLDKYFNGVTIKV